MEPTILNTLFQLALIVFVALLWLLPVSKILERAGFSGWYSLVTLIPIVNLIALWWFASAKWPGAKARALRRAH